MELTFYLIFRVLVDQNPKMDEEEVAAICRRNPEDFSASATVIPFDSPLPLLRGPVPAGHSDDPTAGPFVLAFRDADSWRSAFRSTESKMMVQCEVAFSSILSLKFLFFLRS